MAEFCLFIDEKALDIAVCLVEGFAELIGKGLIEVKENTIACTYNGLLFVDAIAKRFF